MKYDKDQAQKACGLFLFILEPSLKDNEFLEKGVLSGFQYILISGMLSGLNNLTTYNVSNHKFVNTMA